MHASSDLIEKELARGDSLSIISLVNGLLIEAHRMRASDIHIDPTARGVRVRLRIDGVMQTMHELPRAVHMEVISRVKVLAGLRTDEHQSSQDGRFRHTLENGEHIDMRVSIIPTYHGENCVIRLLQDKAADFMLGDLGFKQSDQEKIVSAIRKPSGMILATGPTGSGKTTTLYTLLKMLNSPEVSIVTIEDPIEYAIDEIEQIQVNTRAGLTFGSGLRSILRQDPNIIMVGEIRDAETAGIAVNTALTGHLLLSSLHTNSAATTLPRLLDMGIDAYLVASTVNVAIGQRLVRKICQHCREKKTSKGETHYSGRGCDACKGSGYNGRVSINEVLVADQKIRDAIVRKASADELQTLAKKAGMTTMHEDGLEKVRSGLTSREELLRVTYD